MNCYTFGDPSLLRCYITSHGKQLPTFQRITEPSSSSSPRYLIAVLELLDPEDEGAIILQNGGNCVSIDWCNIPEDVALQQEHHMDLKSQKLQFIVQMEQLQAQSYL